jgi:hypothetical protein
MRERRARQTQKTTSKRCLTSSSLSLPFIFSLSPLHTLSLSLSLSLSRSLVCNLACKAKKQRRTFKNSYACRFICGERERERDEEIRSCYRRIARGGGFGKMWEPARESLERLSLLHRMMRFKTKREREREGGGGGGRRESVSDARNIVVLVVIVCARFSKL